MSPQAQQAGRDALLKVDEALAARPSKDDDVLSDAVQALCTYRDGLIADGAVEDETGRTRLEALNGVLAVVLGTHFPQAETPWDELGKARGWLAGLVGAE